MNCQWVQQNVPLYLYHELADDARFELEQHLRRCGACARELDELRTLHQQLDAPPQSEVTPNLLASAGCNCTNGWKRQSRQAGGGICFLRPGGLAAPDAFFTRSGFRDFPGRLRFRRGGNVSHGGRRAKGSHWRQSRRLAQSSEASVLGVRSIQQDPKNDRITIQYQTTKPEQVQGSLSDPGIQRLLLYAARTNQNSGVRMNSLDLLKQKPDDSRIREGLVFALRYDSNPGARLKALEAVAPYVRGDIRVRNAILEALLNDNSPGVRMGALNALKPSRADTSVRQALQQLAKDEPNPAVRKESRAIFVSTPEID